MLKAHVNIFYILVYIGVNRKGKAGGGGGGPVVVYNDGGLGQ